LTNDRGGDRGTISVSTADRVYRVHARDADSFPWAERLNGLVPTPGEDGWWSFDLEAVRAAGLLPFRSYFAHWVDCIQRDRQPVVTGEEGRASLEIILAGYGSAARRQFVDLRRQTW
jgi:predicted dehydrogenase